MTLRSFKDFQNRKQLEIRIQTLAQTGRQFSRPGPGRPRGRHYGRPPRDQVDPRGEQKTEIKPKRNRN